MNQRKEENDRRNHREPMSTHVFRYGYTIPACSNLAQVCSVPLTFICLKEAWTMWTEKCLTVVVRHKAPASLR